LGYGYGIKNEKQFLKASLSIKPSDNLYANLEVMQYKLRNNGSINHKDNSLIGSNKSYIASMLVGLKLRPIYDFYINSYVGVGTTIGYSPVVSIGILNAGIGLTYMMSSWFSIYLDYKNITLLLSPTLDINHFVSSGIQITF
jgi:hypothetical protein